MLGVLFLEYLLSIVDNCSGVHFNLLLPQKATFNHFYLASISPIKSLPPSNCAHGLGSSIVTPRIDGGEVSLGLRGSI